MNEDQARLTEEAQAAEEAKAETKTAGLSEETKALQAELRRDVLTLYLRHIRRGGSPEGLAATFMGEAAVLCVASNLTAAQFAQSAQLAHRLATQASDHDEAEKQRLLTT